MDLLHYTVFIYIIVKFHTFPVVEIMKYVILSHSTTSLKGLSFKRCHLIFKKNVWRSGVE